MSPHRRPNVRELHENFTASAQQDSRSESVREISKTEVTYRDERERSKERREGKNHSAPVSDSRFGTSRTAPFEIR